ncbi:MAG: phosphatidate cytidylyltransferase [Bacteroidales bacterium]|nr:phosphatidate cytidylyltransferase [Bacteroidales bacterium]
MKNLIVRTVSGIVFIATIIIPLFYAETWFVMILGVYALLANAEYIRLINVAGNKAGVLFSVGLATVLFALFVLSYFGMIGYSLLWSLIPLVVLMPVVISFFTSLPGRFGNAILVATGLLLTVVPLGLLTTALNWYASFDTTTIKILVLALFVITWTHDVFAYLTGIVIGKHPLAKYISPAKTVEGSVGGVVFAFIGAALFYAITQTMSPLYWIGVALIVAVAGTAGDLMQSVLKRRAGVKDSGNIMPGHGGIYDRFDALFIIIPFWFCWLLIFSFILN